MVLRVCSIALACVIGLPLGQAAAQSSYGYHPRVVPGPYADEPPPGYYDPRGAVRRLPPSFYEQDGVVYDRRGRRVIFYDAATGLPLARRYGRVAPGPYADDADPLPRPAFRRPYGGRFVPDDGEGALPERQAALPQYEQQQEYEQRQVPQSALPQYEHQQGRQSALPQGPYQNSFPPSNDEGKAGSAADLVPRLRRQVVEYRTKEPAGTIIVDTRNTYLYYVMGNGQAVRYGIGVGRDGFTWSGREKVSRMAEWPDWYPPQDMIERQPYLPRMMAGGPGNPLGARALYLGNTLYRIHGTSDPSSIGKYVSSGCIRLLNEDIKDLYGRVHVGSRVVVLPGGKPPATASARRR